MRNIMINEAESIFEPFWDGGDSYPNHQKYGVFSEYQISDGDGGEIIQEWSHLLITIYPNSFVSMERDCDLDVSEFDVFRVFASLQKNLKLHIFAVLDGKEVEIINKQGFGETAEFNGKFDGEKITHIKALIENPLSENGLVSLYWFGLSNESNEKKMLSKKSPYDEQWQGCFTDAQVLEVQNGVRFSADELDKLRKKVNSESFLPSMNKLRENAKKMLAIKPEEYIDTFLPLPGQKRFIRERDKKKPSVMTEMADLAFVALIDNDIELGKMACRIALSLCHCTYFCETPMGVFPGATWHHRSFAEEIICVELINVLDWCGSLLTWHGKNIIYDAIIMKGIPRMDADIKTMDYLWYMNQGIAFASSYICTLIGLQKRYPRYASRIDEVEKDLLTMWDNYVLSDGGSSEGPGYWNFTMLHIVQAIYLLAEYRGKSLPEYASEVFAKSSKYALSMLMQNGRLFPVNDTRIFADYYIEVYNFFAKLNIDSRWTRLNNQQIKQYREPNVKFLIYAEFSEEKEEKSEEFVTFPLAGVTKLTRKTNDLGDVSFYAVSGVITHGHSHCDKGSFVIEAGGKRLFLDRGVCDDYSNPITASFGNSEAHNMLVLFDGNNLLSQGRNAKEYSGKVTKSCYNNGVFEYETDTTDAWKNRFTKCLRRFYSENAYEYTIEDEGTLKEPSEACIVFNTYGEIYDKNGEYYVTLDGVAAKITPENYTPKRAVIEKAGVDGDFVPVNSLKLYTEKCDKFLFRTKLTLEFEGK